MMAASSSSPSSVQFGLPPRSLFKLPFDAAPPALPPPFESSSLRTPFPIDADLFNKVLQPAVPLTIAATYITTVSLVNGINRRRGNKPWAISKTKIFYVFVLIHNILLAAYSGVTFVGIVRALHRIMPGLDSEHGFTDVVDAFCKPNGPRGLGSAATYDATATWSIRNPAYHLAANGYPDSTDVGRMWNEGLAFWGWFFYLSKFYEVLDTFIILAKGKRSSTLQTYHHAGAMLCMWAGMRYMASPIWIFVTWNSLIHTLMYTYYTISALGLRVPQVIKRTLTTLQILQFIFGASLCAVHLFLSYTIPVSTPYAVIETVKSVVSAASSTASSVASEATATAAATVTAGNVASYLKKLAFLAAGEEGMAENVRIADNAQEPFAPVISAIAKPLVKTFQKQTTQYRTEYHRIHCVETSAQAFAVYLNLVYLFPLTILFMRFFVKSYLRRISPASAPRKTNSKAPKEDAWSNSPKATPGADTRRVSETFQKLGQVIKESRVESPRASGQELLEKGKKLSQDGTVSPYRGEAALQKKLREALAKARADSFGTKGNGHVKSSGLDGHLTPPPSDGEELSTHTNGDIGK